jgi:hypothetical protein
MATDLMSDGIEFATIASRIGPPSDPHPTGRGGPLPAGAQGRLLDWQPCSSLTPVLWSVLIATLASRKAKLARLLGVLLPQAEAHGRVEVLGLHNNGERGLGDYKQALLEAAAGEYVSFADDDDLVEPDFVAAVTGCMAAGPD